MNYPVIEKLFEILPTLYINKIPPNSDEILFKSKELVKNLSNIEKIKLYETTIELDEVQEIIELAVLLNDIWDKDYQFNNKELTQKKELIEIYLKYLISPFNLNLVFEILDNIKVSNKYFGKYEIIKDIVTDILNLELLNLNVIDKLIIYSKKNNNPNISKFISKKCKDEIFNIKNSIRISYAREIATNSEKQLKLIVMNPDLLSSHINTRVNVLKNSSYF